jgi:hypothetical protein
MAANKFRLKMVKNAPAKNRRQNSVASMETQLLDGIGHGNCELRKPTSKNGGKNSIKSQESALTIHIPAE